MARKEEIIKERLRKLEELKRLKIEPYAYSFDKTHNAMDLQEKYKKLKAGSRTKMKVKIAGRVMVVRDIGKLIFSDLQDESGKIQIQLQEKETPQKQIDFFKRFIERGDFIGVSGTIIKTKRGELTVLANKVKLLTKSILPLPEKWHGLQDKEERYRKRYLDLIMNPEVKNVFLTREKIIEAIREFMKKRGYVEVQTPILQPIYGGGSARPFESKLNALNMKVYMRIANELYLKRLIVGGFEKIFEFSIDFRNEGIDRSHNPEFMLFEAMTAYDDYKDGMKLIEEITEYVVKKVMGKTKVSYQGKMIDFKKPWEKISVKEAIKKYANLDIEKTNDKKLKQIIKDRGIKLKGEFNRGNAIMALIEEFCEKHFFQPTILYDYPIETSTLAKPKRDDPRYAERFEQYYNCFEAGNNYSELNDPKILEENWKKQEEALRKGDKEAQRMDRDFINALKVGMPPTCGIAISIDRLTMVLTNQSSIRDVILFPFMRPEK
jgi:lysyl-tRNA synthetase class 2